LGLVANYINTTFFADKRMRLAVNYAIGCWALSEAETLGASIPTGSIIPRHFEFVLPIEPYPYAPAKARQWLAEADYPNGEGG
jgi:ABC-type transport system substrate-binding protein